MDFDIKVEVNEDGTQKLIYLISGKSVSKEAYYSLKQENQERKAKMRVKENNSEEYLNDEICERCSYFNEIIVDLKEADDKEAYEILNDFIMGVEEDVYEMAFEEGFILGTKSILRNFVEEMNQIIYGNIEVGFEDKIEMELED